MDTGLKVKFWGTRGLVSSPRKETAVYGGNTPSIQILSKDQILIVDTGFGVSNLGEELMAKILQEKSSLNIHILYTHFHWDHIQGLPFFHPIYFPSTTINIYSPLPHEHVESCLDVLFDGSYSPFSGIRNMPSKILFHDIPEFLQLGNLQVRHHEVTHVHQPKSILEKTFSYKITDSNHSLVIATDHEAFDSQVNEKFIAFASNCNLLIHDAQFTSEEYEAKKNWGHSSFHAALSNAKASKAKRTLLTHHDPKRDDDEINSHFLKLKKDFRDIKFEFAKEGILYAVA